MEDGEIVVGTGFIPVRNAQRAFYKLPYGNRTTVNVVPTMRNANKNLPIQ